MNACASLNDDLAIDRKFVATRVRFDREIRATDLGRRAIAVCQFQLGEGVLDLFRIEMKNHRVGSDRDVGFGKNLCIGNPPLAPLPRHVQPGFGVAARDVAYFRQCCRRLREVGESAIRQ